MTTNLEKIYDQYRRADFSDRLTIYLKFPELRNSFLEIEQKEGQSDFFKTAKPPSRSLNLIEKLISRSFSFFL